MAYIAALGVAVLIVYVMSLPMSNAAQGGYVVAVVLAGCAFGAASAFFRELTEGLGCALGGFCISMWLLCLVPGGLIRAAAGKAIMIGAFTLVGFCFYFSRWTRDWAMIVFIAFSGATVVVLGLDCFSRAGLKEFWAYVWNLNDNLFPFGANTYPVTKGIRVETALIIILSLAGIISQIKLWRIVREQREKRAAERAEGQRDLEAEEENVGRNIQQQTARDKAEWEKVYGNGKVANNSESRVSVCLTIDKEKVRTQSVSTYAHSHPEGFEKAESSSAASWRARGDPTMSPKAVEDGQVTIRVASDEVVIEEDETLPGDKATESQPGSRRGSKQKEVSQSHSVTPAPEIVPLPFNVPDDGDDDTATKASGNRSSFATLADEDRGNRLSVDDRRLSGRKSSDEAKLSVEDDRSSLAATMDIASISGGLRFSMMSFDNYRKSGESTDETANTVKEISNSHDESASTAPVIEVNMVDKENTKADEAQLPEEPKAPSVTDKKGESPAVMSGDGANPSPEAKISGDDDPSKGASEVQEEPEVQVESPSLTRDLLPKSLSKVAMSYRTNEWAKHLSLADAPELDEICIAPLFEPAKKDGEVARAVDVEDLQKTAQDGAVSPTPIKRSDSQLSTRSKSARSIMSPRHLSTGFDTIAEERARINATPAIFETEEEYANVPVSPVAGQPGEHLTRSPASGVVSFSSPHTLLGQRETWLRNKSQGTPMIQTPEPTSPFEVPALDDPLFNYSMYAAAMSPDADNVPLSQRKEMMRQSSAFGSPTFGHRTNSGVESSEATLFNSHQPVRTSLHPPASAREAKLANFRQSVAQDLRCSTPGIAFGGPLIQSTATSYMNIDAQRNSMMNQMEMEVQRREQRRREKEHQEAVFDSRMRNGDLLDAHREVLRRMQNSAKDT
ncbi:hypothetical protein ESCO_002470 [Escovopsis weberi]|uniref:TM7S3/TM198-like domain-containing protein n=1 Tax=Escovopsis weberi TaxID=150374 RepID=A0A0M8MSP7_ESCWE|nr:hypothetical protein ESCO_002470 [Escovopsis weberi]